MIRDLLQNKTAEEVANIKATELAKLEHEGSYEYKDYTILIKSFKAIPGGVELLAQVWKDGEPVGFGGNGTIETERFRFINPPTCIEDPGGDVVRESVNKKDGKVSKIKYKEDPRAAIREVLGQSVELMGKDGANIIVGSVGNTTTTVYASTADTRTGDQDPSWATCRAAASGDYVDATSDTFSYVQAEKQTNYNIDVPFFMFDTSSLVATDPIASAIFSLYDMDDSSDTDPIGVLQSTQTTWNSIVVGDYSKRGTTEGATRLSSFTANAYNNWTLNATGIGFIARSGETKPASASASGKTQLCIRMARDIDDTTPAGRSYRKYAMADYSGTTQDPKLVISQDVVLAVTDNVSISEAITVTRAVVASVSDTVNITESLTTTRAAVASVSDNIGITESMSADRPWEALDKRDAGTWANLNET